MTPGKKNADKTKLKELCNQLLEEESPKVLLDSSRELYRLLLQTGGIDENHTNYKNDLILPSGKAIGTLWAAMCINDYLRTQRFFRGIYQAVNDTKQKYPSEKIHILYAGTGPFATLALQILSSFTAEEVTFTFLEIQESSVNILHRIIEYYDFQDHISKIIQADATNYLLEKPKEIHIVISETMQHALEKEPQVEITLNLAKQIDKKTIWIPQNIIIDAALLSQKRDHDRQMGVLPSDVSSFVVLETIFELNKKTALKKSLAMDKNILLTNKKTYKIPKDLGLLFPWLVLFTTIHIYGDQYLKTWDSGLCAPRILVDLLELPSFPKKVEFLYKTGTSPGFEYELLF